MRNRKSLLAIGLSIGMIGNLTWFCLPAYADITVPPHPSAQENGNRLPGQALPGGLPGTGSGAIAAGDGQPGSGTVTAGSGQPGSGTVTAGSGQPGSKTMTAGSGQAGSGTVTAGSGQKGQGPGGAPAVSDSPVSVGPGSGQKMPAGTASGQQSAEAGAGQQPADGSAKGQQAAPNQPVQTQLQEPEIAAEGAVLVDGATGKVLYGKNADQQFYPASITKIMTALLVLERCGLSDTVTFSAGATTNLESGAVSLDITEGDRLTVEQSLHGLLMKSANEIGNGLAEHVAGSVSGFAELMNTRARELGCTNTNFVNPHGLNHSSHKTTPHDMALIMRAALQNKDFRRIDTTLTYDFPATRKAAARTITMGHKMMYPSDSRYYEGIIGGKTGYTSLAGNTLVTGAERNGVQLIVVIMKSKQTHYTDTKALLDYGFANYQTLMGSQGQ